ncbi:MAG: 23S rRNA (guanosine(2251)-2'-O)-methyltransferase RlmB [Sphaerochaetaceae bacterium]|jgi:23S rRNA (guanosine2251-2'-O)-methyltransferase
MAKRIIGFHAIEENLKTAAKGSVLYLQHNPNKRHLQLEQQANERRIKVQTVSTQELDSLSSSSDHKGAVLVLVASSQRRIRSLDELIEHVGEKERSLVVLLDGITDVQNLGAIMRSADQFSVDAVIIPQRRSAQNNETVMRISSGAARYVPLISVTNLVRELEFLQKQGYWVYGADMSGTSIAETSFAPKSVIVMGSEGEGLGQLVHKRCDHIISIPTSGHIDSLNVSVATGIILYEYRRQNS